MNEEYYFFGKQYGGLDHFWTFCFLLVVTTFYYTASCAPGYPIPYYKKNI